MEFTELSIPGAFRVELEPHADERGFFARAWCRREFADRGITSDFVQANLSFTRRAGTVRGLHYQEPPHAEAKLVRCLRGSVYDVMVDLRPDSPAHLEWLGCELTPDDRTALHVPEGCAHGYQALEDESELFYLVSEFYAPDAEGGIRFDDPALGIQWPRPVSLVSQKDRSWPDYVADVT